MGSFMKWVVNGFTRFFIYFPEMKPGICCLVKKRFLHNLWIAIFSHLKGSGWDLIDRNPCLDIYKENTCFQIDWRDLQVRESIILIRRSAGTSVDLGAGSGIGSSAGLGSERNLQYIKKEKPQIIHL